MAILTITYVSLVNGTGNASAAEYHTLAVPAQYGTIQSAVNAANIGDTVLVSDGTYSENINFIGKAITVKSVNGAATTKIQGSGANSPVVTFASGETSNALLEGFTIDNQASTNTAARGIAVTGGASPTISKCLIQGNSVTATYVNGAGVYISGATADIRDTTFDNNTASLGGALYGTSMSGPLSISNSIFTYNSAKTGGAVYMASTGQLTTIANSAFSHNSVTNTNGGALYGNDAPITITGGSINNNNSLQDGGAICMYGASATLTVSGSSITDNTGRNGGAIYSWSAPGMSISDSTIDSNTGVVGGAIYLNANTSSSTFTNTSISDNQVTSTHGGGIYSNSALSLNSCSVDNNTTAMDGGGIYLMGGSATTSISGSTINGNHGRNGAGIYQGAGVNLTIAEASINDNRGLSTGSGGGIYAAGASLNMARSYINGNRSGQNGGGIYNLDTTVTIVNSTIAGNTADQQTYSDGGGIYSNSGTLNVNNSTLAGNYAFRYGGGLRQNSGTVVFTNGIIWGNTTGTSNPQIYGSPTVKYSDVEGGYPGDSNISTSPVLVDMQTASNANPTSSGDYHYVAGSPGIDAASAQYAVADDIDGDSRPQGAGYDMGSDEFTGGGAPGDTTPPDVTSVLPSGTISTTSATIAAYYNDSGSGINSASVAMYLDGSPLSGCSITTASAACDVYGLGNGTHVISGSVSDNAGNTSPIDGSFTVNTGGGGDSTPPSVYNLQPSTIIYTSSAVLSAYYSDSGSGIDTSTVAVTLDGNTVSGCTVLTDHVSCPVSELASGPHMINVSVKDIAGNPGSGSVGFFVVLSCESGKPPLTLYNNNTYWFSYSEYTLGLLSVDFSIHNSGNDAYGVMLEGTISSNGVVCVTQGMPISLGDITGSSSKQLTLKYSVPAGVASFKTTLYATSHDSCGNQYTYPGPFPGV